ncbi:hypothetical protein BGZ92_001112 [Podila epicladia]|nr:hypothetical protein BGZ92_001112 [Podila epicladia]
MPHDKFRSGHDHRLNNPSYTPSATSQRQQHPRPQHLSHQPSSAPTSPSSPTSSRQSLPHGHASMTRHSVIGQGAHTSRTPRRDSSLPSPLTTVLPALPPLMPVPVSSNSTLTSPVSPAKIQNDTLVPTNDLSISASSTAEEIATETEATTTPRNSSSDDANNVPSSPSRTHVDDSAVSSPTAKEANLKDQDKPLSAWPETPRQFLERLKETVSKAELGNVLSKGSDSFNQAVLRTHMESFDFRRDPIDMALRKFLLDFHFPKEAQQIDRVLEAFAFRYHACNPHLFRSAEVVYTIAFSLMLLHTDAHNKNVRYKMTKEQYVRQAKSIDGVNTIPTDILEILYDNITFLKFVYAEDELDVDGQPIADVQPTGWFPRRRTASNQRSDSYSMIRHGSISHLAPDISDLIPFRWPYYWKGTIEMVDNVQINNQFTKAPVARIPGLRSRRNSQHFGQLGANQWSMDQGTNMAHDHPDMDSAVELKIAKFGILTRKIDIENGKKSSVRGWRDLGVILSGSQLLFFTELSWFQNQKASQRGFNPQAPPEVDGFFSTELGGETPPMPQALISTLDSIAVVDSSYQKYPHVFRLVCPNGKQYLFRANSEYDMNDWMAKINYASAFKTAGVRLRSYRVAWASDVYWIKDEQGRHQLRRRLPASTETDSAQINGRADLIKAKMKDIDKLINTCAASLAAELRLARGLEVMIPLQTVTRQKIVQSAAVVGRRLRHLMLERTKLDCFRTILERDLAVIVAPCDNPEEYTCHEQWISSQSLSEGSSTLRSQRSIDRNGDYFKLSLAMDDRVDPAKEEYVLDSSRTSQSSNRSIKGVPRSRLNIPEFSRAASETALSDQQRLRSLRGMDIPQGPLAVQAAIIGAARGTLPSTMSSPDPNQYQESRPSQQSSNVSVEASAPSTPPPSKATLSPDSLSPTTTRARALSTPGERPANMPRTVSIYSSSSQTANRLKRIFEQGLGHFKWRSPAATPSKLGSSSPSYFGSGRESPEVPTVAVQGSTPPMEARVGLGLSTALAQISVTKQETGKAEVHSMDSASTASVNSNVDDGDDELVMEENVDETHGDHAVP